MLDLDAPIVPGEGAAGIPTSARGSRSCRRTSSRASASSGASIRACPTNAVLAVYRSDGVYLWVENRVVDQIEAHGDYRGTLRGAVGVGSTVAEVEARIGPVIEDDDGSLAIRDISGSCFEVDGAPDRYTHADDPIPRPRPIKQIFVYRT